MQQEFLLAAILTATALSAATALILSYLHWKAQKPGQRDHLKKAKSLDQLLRGHPRPMKPFALLAVAALAFAVLAWHVAHRLRVAGIQIVLAAVRGNWLRMSLRGVRLQRRAGLARSIWSVRVTR
jgi:type IV secretory pathway TrbD component